MGKLLPLEIGETITLKNIDGIKDHLFTCKKIQKYYNQFNYPSYRYIVDSQENEDEYILDVSKCYNKDIKILCFKELEEMEFDQNFLSLVGTSPLGYHHPNMKNIDYVLYNIEELPLRENQSFKYMVSEDELPEDPKEHGYMQDGNGNWYFLTHRDRGALLDFEDHFKRFWEYKQDDNERLLIETKGLKDSWAYIKEKPSIMVYSGKRLKRSQIKLSILKQNKHYVKI